MRAKLLQLCQTLWSSLHGSSLYGILQARILKWIAMSSSRGSSQLKDRTQVFHIAGRFFTICATREAQEYWSWYPIPSPGYVPTQELNQGPLHCRQIPFQLSYQ